MASESVRTAEWPAARTGRGSSCSAGCIKPRPPAAAAAAAAAAAEASTVVVVVGAVVAEDAAAGGVRVVRAAEARPSPADADASAVAVAVDFAVAMIAVGAVTLPPLLPPRSRRRLADATRRAHHAQGSAPFAASQIGVAAAAARLRARPNVAGRVPGWRGGRS